MPKGPSLDAARAEELVAEEVSWLRLVLVLFYRFLCTGKMHRFRSFGMGLRLHIYNRGALVDVEQPEPKVTAEPAEPSSSSKPPVPRRSNSSSSSKSNSSSRNSATQLRTPVSF